MIISPVATLFLFKLAIPPVLVAAMTLAARRFGPTVAGLILGLPWMTGPINVFLALDKGADYAVAACIGVELAVISIFAFAFTWGWLARHVPWFIGVPAGASAFVATGFALRDVALPLLTAAALGATILAASPYLLPVPRTRAVVAKAPGWDIPARMAATAGMVSFILLATDVLGPRLSGVASSFPVILTVVGAFTQAQSGPDSLLGLMRGTMLSLLGFVAFFAVFGSALPLLPLPVAVMLAAVAALSASAALIAARTRSTRATALATR